MAKSPIVDAWGRPYEYHDEPQTVADPNLAIVASRAQTHPSSGIDPNRAAMTMRAAEQGDLTAQADLAEDIEEKDSHIQAELGKRRRSLLSVGWMIKPPRNASVQEKIDAAWIEEVLRDAVWLQDMIFDASDAILKGYSAQEITWQYAEKKQIPQAIEWRDPGIFQIHPKDKNLLMLRDGSYTGVAPNVFGWMIHRAKSKSGYVSRIGLIRTLVWPFIFKNYSVRDLAEFLEIYGLPLRVGKYPSGASEKEKATLLKAVMSIGHNAGGIIPMGMTIDFQDAAKGQSDPFTAMIDWCEKSVSKAILGGTLTSSADGKTSTNALGEVHDQVRTEVRDSDLSQLAITINRDLIYPLYALNCKSCRSPTRQPQIEFDTSEPEDIKTYSAALPSLVSVGLQIPASWVHEKLRIPEPKPGEAVLSTGGITDATRPAPAKKSDPAPLAALAATNPELDELDDMAASVTGEQWSAVMLPILQPIIDAINTDGPAAAMAAAAELFPKMDDTQLTQLLTRAIFAVDVWGRLDGIDQ